MMENRKLAGKRNLLCQGTLLTMKVVREGDSQVLSELQEASGRSLTTIKMQLMLRRGGFLVLLVIMD